MGEILSLPFLFAKKAKKIPLQIWINGNANTSIYYVLTWEIINIVRVVDLCSRVGRMRQASKLKLFFMFLLRIMEMKLLIIPTTISMVKCKKWTLIFWQCDSTIITAWPTIQMRWSNYVDLFSVNERQNGTMCECDYAADVFVGI